jgi:hypothetical protein
VFCSGFGTGSSYTAFADGEFGSGTVAAVQEFQRSGPNPLTDDAIVGPQTWDKLQNAIVLLESGNEFSTNENGEATVQDSYGFATGRCADIPLFYQTLISVDETTFEESGWRLARNTPYEDESLLFDYVFRRSDL